MSVCLFVFLSPSDSSSTNSVMINTTRGAGAVPRGASIKATQTRPRYPRALKRAGGERLQKPQPYTVKIINSTLVELYDESPR